MNQKKSIDPYQVLFPIGLAHALMGTIIWVFHALHWINYPGPRHTHYMMTGFLISFATGFLLTAIPRFTGSAGCSTVELAFATGISLLSLVFVSPIFALLQLFFLVVFGFRRIRSRAFNPPVYFMFLPIGLIMGIVGATVLSLIQFEYLDSTYLLMGKLFLYYGMMLSFLLGIGAKLIAALLGWAPPPNQLIPLTKKRGIGGRQMILPILQATLFVMSFIIEAVGNIELGRIFRASCVAWIAIQHWRIYRYPANRGNLSLWIFISAWMLVGGLWTHALFPQLDLHGAHLIFVGGFGLMTLMVASRVSLAHGGYSLETESKSKIFYVVGLLILVAMVTRVTAPWMKMYIPYLAYAAITWIIAIGCWAIFFVPKIIFRDGGIAHTFHNPKKPNETC